MRKQPAQLCMFYVMKNLQTAAPELYLGRGMLTCAIAIAVQVTQRIMNATRGPQRYRTMQLLHCPSCAHDIERVVT